MKNVINLPGLVNGSVRRVEILVRTSVKYRSTGDKTRVLASGTVVVFFRGNNVSSRRTDGERRSGTCTPVVFLTRGYEREWTGKRRFVDGDDYDDDVVVARRTRRRRRRGCRLPFSLGGRSPPSRGSLLRELRGKK